MKRQNIYLAKILRKNQTLQEAKLWVMLRSRRFDNHKFVRQFSIGNYIVDFCCRKKKLIIEVDGGGHGEDKQIKYDKVRDEYLKKEGYKIFRITNYELSTNFDGCLDAIYYELNNL
jgi:very-short-patch-repair endonuclease